MAEHAPLAPSAAPTWRYCPGSRALQVAYPEIEDGAKAMEGVAAHWVCSELLAKRNVTLGQLAPNGVPVTDEMLDGAEMYCDDIIQTWPGPRRVEERISCETIHSDCWGTPDTWAFIDLQDVIYLWDYKFGHGFVEVYENWQLIAYAAGILARIGVGDRTRVVMRIVQPRNFHRDGPIREWSVTAAQLRPYIQQLQEAARLAMQPDAPCRAGTYCQHCTARAYCPTLQAAAMAACEFGGSATPLELSPAAMGAELAILQRLGKLLKARQTGLEEAAEALLRRGGQVPYFKLQQGSGRLNWTRPHEEVVALGDMMGVKLVKPATITPTQAQKAGIPPDLIAAYAARSPGELELVPDDGMAARKAFNQGAQPQ